MSKASKIESEAKQKIVSQIYELESMTSNKLNKWRDNLRLYSNRFNMELNDLKDSYAESVFGYMQGETDTTSPIVENVVKSCVETLTSKIASQKAHPFFNTVNGTFRQVQITKQAQQFFDLYFNEMNVNKIVADCFRDACIFNVGVVHIDRDSKKVERVMPWQVFVDPREFSYNHLTRAVWKRPHYPTSLLDRSIKREDSLSEVTLYSYFDLNTAKEWTFIPELNYLKSTKLEYTILPFLFLFYDSPLKGYNGNSIADMLKGIQEEINMLLIKVRDASQLSPAMTYFVPENSTIKTTRLTNRTGEIVTYTPTQEGGSPVTVATPAFIDPQYVSLIATLKQDAYEMVGISQLSATSQKPSGLNSGVALSTMEDIESDRFETQLNQVIRLYTDIAKCCMSIFPAEEAILPQSIFRNNVTWKDIVECKNEMNIQFSAMQSLSKDPSTKLQQIQALVSAGFISQTRAGTLLQMPDLESGYSFANNAIEAVLAVIDNCLYFDDYTIPEFVNTNLLMEEILNTQLSLYANSANRDLIDKLTKLMKVAEEMMIDCQSQAEMGAQANLTNQVNAMLPQIQQQATNMMNQQLNSAFPDMQATQTQQQMQQQMQ